MPKNNKVRQADSNRIAENNFKQEKKNNRTETTRGLAETHQQVTDQFFEGTVDQKFK